MKDERVDIKAKIETELNRFVGQIVDNLTFSASTVENPKGDYRPRVGTTWEVNEGVVLIEKCANRILKAMCKDLHIVGEI